MEIQNLLIGIAIFSLVIVGLWGTTGFFTNLSGVYSTTDSTSLEDLDRIDALQTIADSAKNTITSTNPGGAWSDQPIELVTGAFAVLTSLWTLPGTLTGVITASANILHAPTWFVTGISTILFLAISWQIVSALIKWRV
jgi:hypothetical protein